MNRNRLPLLVLAVAALVAVVALVASGRPLAASAGRGGLSSTFWDYAFTSVVIIGGLVALTLVALLIGGAPMPQRWTPPPHTRSLVSVLAVGFIGGLLFLIFRFIHLPNRLLHGHQHQPSIGGGGGGGRPPRTSGQAFQFRWEELAVVVGLLLVAGTIAVVATRRRGALMRPEWTAPEALAEALDESLEDLRGDPDLRRAIIAAYARMEKALGAVGVPRRPAEAPLEYLERALLELDTSGASVRRLTDLFEWARFSHHEPEPPMRDEAVDALEAVRDELRAPAEVLA